MEKDPLGSPQMPSWIAKVAEMSLGQTDIDSLWMVKNLLAVIVGSPTENFESLRMVIQSSKASCC
jgi:hypothetical protein